MAVNIPDKMPVKPIYSSKPKHSVLPGAVKEDDAYEFQGHVFEKTKDGRKAALCGVCHKSAGGTLAFGRNKCMSCKTCGLHVHVKHIKDDDTAIRPCVGDEELCKTYTFMAADAAEKKEWVEHLSNIVLRRSDQRLASMSTGTPKKHSSPGSLDVSGQASTPREHFGITHKRGESTKSTTSTRSTTDL